MKNETRTTNITKNVFAVVVTQILTLLFAFGNRTVFIHLLGKEYLGIDGLFTSILTIFSLAELGIGHALIFSLYAPIANNDTPKAQQYLTLYKKAYHCIFSVILVAGLLLMPFLKDIVNADIDSLGINIYIVYILFLLNTLSSYILAYRQAVLVVKQRQRIVSVWQTAGKLLVYLLECLVLLASGSYYIFLAIRVIGNYFIAIKISSIAKKRYPELCETSSKSLSKDEIKRISKNVYALFIRRVGGVVLASTDNIIINKYISLSMVGVYSNYVLIIKSIQTITVQMMSAMTASIGNFVATKNEEQTEKAFNLYTFITYLVYGTCSICFILLVNRFITVLWGSSYTLSRFALYLLVLEFFFYGYQSAINVFRDTTGLFEQGKYRNLFSASLNVVVSILLVQFMGIEGVILGTIFSRVLISSWYDPYILYKHLFRKRPFLYYYRLISYILCVFSAAGLLDFITRNINYNISGLLYCTTICLIIPIILLAFYIKSMECKELIIRCKKIIQNQKNECNYKSK